LVGRHKADKTCLKISPEEVPVGRRAGKSQRGSCLFGLFGAKKVFLREILESTSLRFLGPQIRVITISGFSKREIDDSEIKDIFLM
jgi:hypothetical protein